MIPPFITAYMPVKGMSTEQASKLQGVLTNWLKTHAHIRKLEPSVASLRELACMIFIECYRKRGPRMDVLVRLHGRFDKLRYEVERVQLGHRRRG